MDDQVDSIVKIPKVIENNVSIKGNKGVACLVPESVTKGPELRKKLPSL